MADTFLRGFESWPEVLLKPRHYLGLGLGIGFDLAMTLCKFGQHKCYVSY